MAFSSKSSKANRRKLRGASASVTADSPAVVHAPGSGVQDSAVTAEEAVAILEKTARKRRGMELVLMLLSATLVIIAMGIIQYTVRGHLSWDILISGLSFVAICIILNIAMRVLAPQADPFILPLVTMLNGIGLVLINRLDLSNSGSTTAGMTEGTRQIIWTFIAVVLFVLALWMVRDHRVLSRYSYTLGLVGLILLAIPAILPRSMSEVNGSKIWIRTPFLSIQPGEFSKIVLIISIAAILVLKRELFATTGRQVFGIELPRARDLAPILVVWVVAVLILVLEKDLGTSLLIFATVLTMIYIATNRVSWLVIGVIGFATAALIAYFAFSHVQVRFATWWDPIKYFDTNGYQLSQALFGLATGGVAGSGLGHGRPDLVPYASTDFIISTVGEELGFIGLAAVLVCYAIIVQRCFRTSLLVRDSFGKLMVSGLAFTMAFQVFVVAGGVTRVIPLTGLTTPFLSYGGSSLLANYLLVALVLRVSDAAARPLSLPAGTKLPPAGSKVLTRANRVKLSKQQKAEMSAAPAGAPASAPANALTPAPEPAGQEPPTVLNVVDELPVYQSAEDADNSAAGASGTKSTGTESSDADSSTTESATESAKEEGNNE